MYINTISAYLTFTETYEPVTFIYKTPCKNYNSDICKTIQKNMYLCLSATERNETKETCLET